VFYGWFVVAAAFAVTFVGFGSAYTFSTFVAALQHEFGASRGSVSLVFSLAGFLYFALGIITGPLADRFGSRRVALTGMLILGAGLALAGLARNLFQVYLAYGLGVGLGIGCSYVPALGAVQRWFVKRRGLASGLAVSGIGVGTLVMPPIASFLIDTTSWRHAYVILGAVSACIGAGAALLIENDPHDRGLTPDGEPQTEPTPQRQPQPRAAAQPQRQPQPRAGNETAAPGSSLSIRDQLKSRQFAVLYGACLIGSFGLFVPFVHLVPYAKDHGIPESTAVLLLAVMGASSTAGRFVLGGAADRLGRRRAVLAMFVGMAAASIVWAAATSVWTLTVFALTFGTFYGGFVALLPALVMDYFGGRHISSILGALYTSVAFGTLTGPAAAGYAFDLRHSYTLPIAISIATSLTAAAIMLVLPEPRGERK
jgi:MFS family permease